MEDSSQTGSFSPASPLSPHASASLPPSEDTPRQPNLVDEASPKEGPTLLTIDLAFSFANPLHRIASQAVLPKVADKMVEAFEQRCVEVYGRGSA
jgi:coenzyme Q-binding protein COQ10